MIRDIQQYRRSQEAQRRRWLEQLTPRAAILKMETLLKSRLLASLPLSKRRPPVALDRLIRHGSKQA